METATTIKLCVLCKSLLLLILLFPPYHCKVATGDPDNLYPLCCTLKLSPYSSLINSFFICFSFRIHGHTSKQAQTLYPVHQWCWLTGRGLGLAVPGPAAAQSGFACSTEEPFLKYLLSGSESTKDAGGDEYILVVNIAFFKNALTAF